MIISIVLSAIVTTTFCACIFDKGDYEGGGRRLENPPSADAAPQEDTGVTVNIVINLGDGG